ncbi:MULTISPECIES: PaaI family thioesterase [Actinomadura]|uniref:PaaI family thioesterase n=1 Tax=Actinomadura TaxID=1988 RepID=UPI0003AD710A|nr:PaaI family thioesterase [Actinomadura madurae]MCP9948452.1 PaaI family thioesterase [Actinomadura madurae]MCP9965231.1 PaaI family thioesterase [Actinomadura madurae]MCP9977720.1 PaaI family thioesterase [Actinomadura madurae]MCQ0010788.1 PaaI family thioesterase [Actinomadura madurae]MCQ0013906.1 PaaI family thioesterase [Actinomadura madurae]
MTVEGGGYAGPLDQTLGLLVTEASDREVVAEIEVTAKLMQAYGIVHGGVYCAINETICSMGAALTVGLDNQVVGVSNHTRFIRAVRGGRLTARARPVDRVDDHVTWQATITDDKDRVVAEGTVNLLKLSPKD